MACHTVNMPFRALKLGYPTVVEAEGHSNMNKETYPLNSRIRFEFPERDGMVPLKFWWYDGKIDGKQNQPHADITSKVTGILGSIRGSGSGLAPKDKSTPRTITVPPTTSLSTTKRNSRAARITKLTRRSQTIIGNRPVTTRSGST